MNYTQFASKHNIIDRLLQKLEIITNKKIFIPIDNTPDYDLSQYQKELTIDYYFKNSWDFSQEFSSLINVEIIATSIFHADDIARLKKELNMETSTESYSKIIQYGYNIRNTLFDEYGMGTDLDDFKLHDIKSDSIDNIKRRFFYVGSFMGDGFYIDPTDWEIIAQINVVGISDEIEYKQFYKSLIAESFILYKEGKYKLSYFLIYSALESFINSESNNPDEEERLKDRLKDVLKNRFHNLQTNQIYNSIIVSYGSFTTNRNTIAHGRNNIEFNETDLLNVLLFTLTLISMYELNVSTFDDLYNAVV